MKRLITLLTALTLTILTFGIEVSTLIDCIQNKEIAHKILIDEGYKVSELGGYVPVEGFGQFVTLTHDTICASDHYDKFESYKKDILSNGFVKTRVVEIKDYFGNSEIYHVYYNESKDLTIMLTKSPGMVIISISEGKE